MEKKLAVRVALVTVFLVGAATFAQAQTRILPDPTPTPRAYLCFEGNGAGDITKKANEAGARGWKMVAATSNGRSSVWCFEQYSAARPQPQN